MTTDREALLSLRHLALALAEAQSVDQIAVAVADHAWAAAGAAFSNVGLGDPAGEVIYLQHGHNLTAEMTARWKAVGLDSSTVLGDAIRRGEPVVVEKLDELERRYPEMRADAEAAGLSALAAFPIADRGGSLRAAIGLGWRTGQPRATDEVLQPVLAICGAALARAWARDEAERLTRTLTQQHQREHDILERLQRGLLPRVLPRLEGYDVDVHYQPASERFEVGGDWYDLIECGDDTYGIVIGDVVGHDLDAALGMSHIRNVLAGLAHARLLPAEVLGRLDEYAQHHPALFATSVFYGLLHAPTGSFTYASAGHLPPLVVDRDGVPRLLDDAVGPPIGVRDARRAMRSITLRLGDTLICYTDGLVEDRARPIDECIQDLLARSAGVEAEPLPLLVDRLIHCRPPDLNVDDLALLVIRRKDDRRDWRRGPRAR